MSFQKGKSGNPGGRARRSMKDGRKLPEMAREYTEEALLATVEIMRDKDAPPAARIQAINNIFDRGWGRAKQEVDIDHSITVESAGVSEALDWIARALGEKEEAAD